MKFRNIPKNLHYRAFQVKGLEEKKNDLIVWNSIQY